MSCLFMYEIPLLSPPTIQDSTYLYQTFTIECNGECVDVVAIHEKEAAKDT